MKRFRARDWSEPLQVTEKYFENNKHNSINLALKICSDIFPWTLSVPRRSQFSKTCSRIEADNVCWQIFRSLSTLVTYWAKKWTQLHKICGLSIHPFGFTKSNGEFYKAVIPVVLFGFAMNRTSSGVTRLVRSLSTRVQFGLSNNFYINKNVSKKKLSFNFPVGHFRLTSGNLYNTSAFREVKLEWESLQCAISQRIV